MNYWLMKSEPDCYSIYDLEKDRKTPWDGVRNYQARNFMKNDMALGDQVLFYHSNAKPPQIVGLAEVISKPYPDPTAFDESHEHFDPKSDPDSPRWFLVDIGYLKTFKHPLSLAKLKTFDNLEGLMLLKKGCRLSVQPVSKKHFDAILKTVQVSN